MIGSLSLRISGRARRGFVLAVLLGLTACAQRPITPPVDLTFLDSPSFDQMMSAAMSGGAQVVAVEIVGPVSPNAMPERLGKWLYAVSSRGGPVQAERDPRVPRPRSFGADAALQLALLTYDLVRRELLYAPADQYGAVVHIVPEQNRVTRILFVRIPGA